MVIELSARPVASIHVPDPRRNAAFRSRVEGRIRGRAWREQIARALYEVVGPLPGAEVNR